MKPISVTLCLFGIVAGMFLATRGEAGDIGAANGVQASSKLNQQIDQAIQSAGTTSQDIDSRIRDLESTSAALDEKKTPKVSLGVSGWVGQQVQYNVKQ